MIELVTGDPWQKDENGEYNHPASYSRFILPFSYHLERAKHLCRKTNSLHFKQTEEKKIDRERLLYFTAETANVLFRRAIWAEVDADLWRNAGFSDPFLFHSVNRYKVLPVTVTLAPPRLVLFEGRADNDSAHPPLHHGFLIQDAFFPASDPSHETPCLDDLLEFNELFRYIDCPFPGHREKFANALAEFPADYSAGSLKTIGAVFDEMADADEQEKEKKSLFCYKNRWLSLLQFPLLTKRCQCFGLRIVKRSWIRCEQNNDSLMENHLACTNNNCFPYADNRAFVWTAAVAEDGGSALAAQYKRKKEAVRPWKFGHWCKLLNVDPPAATPARTHASVRKFEKKWTEERTYQRWAEYGTWYGYSYHSGAMLASITPKNNPPLWRHFGEMYFDQVLLLLYMRVTLFAFSRDMTRINQGNINQLRDTFDKLRAAFAKFTNLYQFPLISNQQQGVEMYNAARKSMDIDDLFKEVQEEIRSTHEFLEMKASRKLGTMANVIASIAAVAAFGSLLPKNPRESIYRFVTDDWSSGMISTAVLLAAGILVLSLSKKTLSRLWRWLTKPIF